MEEETVQGDRSNGGGRKELKKQEVVDWSLKEVHLMEWKE